MTPTLSSARTDEPAMRAAPGYPDDVVQKIRALRSGGLGYAVPDWLTKHGYDASDYNASPDSFDASSTLDWAHRTSGSLLRGAVSGVEDIARAPANLVAWAQQLIGSRVGMSPEAIAGLQGMTVNKFGAGPSVLADRMSLPEAAPGSTLETVTGGVRGAASALPFALGTGGTSILASGFFGGSAAEMAKHAGFGPVGQTVASLLGGATPVTGEVMADRIRKSWAGAESQRQAAANLNSIVASAAGRPGEQVATLGQIAQGGKAQRVEQGVRTGFGGQRRLQAATASQTQGLNQRLGSLVDELAPAAEATPIEAGKAIKAGIQGPPNALDDARNANLYAIAADRERQVAERARQIAELNANAPPPPTAPPLSDVLNQFQGQMTQAHSPEAIAARQLAEQSPTLQQGMAARYPSENPFANDPTAKIQPLRTPEGLPINEPPPLSTRTPLIPRVRVSEGYVARFWDQTRKLYDHVESLVPGSTRTTPVNAAEWFNQHGADGSLSTIMESFGTDPFLANVKEDLANFTGAHPLGMTFEQLKALRTNVDAKIKNFDELLAGTPQRAALRSLRGALTDDMGATVAMNAGKEGVDAWAQANKFYRQGRETIEDLFEPMVHKATPEAVFDAAMNGSKKGGTIIQESMRALQPEQQRILASAVMRQAMGGEIPNAKVWFTNWKKFAPEVRATLTKPFGPQFVADMNNLTQAVDLIDQAAKIPAAVGTSTPQSVGTFLLKNLSAAGATGSVLAAGGAGIPTALGSAAVVGSLSAVKNQILARVLTNPNTVRWLLKTTKVPMSQFGAMAIQLARESQKWNDPEGRTLGAELSKTMTGIDWPKIMMAQSLSDATATKSGNSP